MLDATFTFADCILHLCSHSWPPELVMLASTVSTANPGVQHLGDIHSWQLLGEPWGLQIAKLLPTCPLMCGNGRGLLDRALASSALREQFSPPQYLHSLQAGISDTILSGWRSTRSQS